MAGGELTQTGYIQHHLQNLTFGLHPEQGWGFAHGVQEAKDMGFWAIHVDTMLWSIVLGVLVTALRARFHQIGMWMEAADAGSSGEPQA